MAGADVRLPWSRSAIGRMFKSVGIAAFARGPSCPKAAATHSRIGSSEVSRRAIISFRARSSIFQGSNSFVNSANRSAAFALSVEVFCCFTSSTIRWIFLLITGSPSEEAATNAEFAAREIKANAPMDTFVITVFSYLLIYGAAHIRISGAETFFVESFGSIVVAGRVNACTNHDRQRRSARLSLDSIRNTDHSL
jgi:hypothetical protein